MESWAAGLTAGNQFPAAMGLFSVYYYVECELKRNRQLRLR
jgi:hypothetical protein